MKASPAQSQQPLAQTTMDSPLGELVILASDRGIRAVTTRGDKAFLAKQMATPPTDGTNYAPSLCERAKEELADYFAGDRQSFDLPLDPVGTDFQKRCWRVMADIPFGRTLSYGEVATRAGSPKGFRAAGMAAGANPILILVPCHRVLAAHGHIGGFGLGLDAKRILLNLEGISYIEE